MPVLLPGKPYRHRVDRTNQPSVEESERLDMAEARRKWQLDVASRLRDAFEQGYEQGLQLARQERGREAIEQGKTEKALDMAVKLLQIRWQIGEIAEVTGLSVEQITELANTRADG